MKTECPRGLKPGCSFDLHGTVEDVPFQGDKRSSAKIRVDPRFDVLLFWD
jgi:hypothetical protein